MQAFFRPWPSAASDRHARGSAADLKLLHHQRRAQLGTSNRKAAPESYRVASAPLLPKFASEDAAMYHELRKRGTRCRTLVAFLTDKVRTALRARPGTRSSRERFGYDPPMELTPFPKPKNKSTGPRALAFCARILIVAALMGVTSMLAARQALADAQLLL